MLVFIPQASKLVYLVNRYNFRSARSINSATLDILNPGLVLSSVIKRLRKLCRFVLIPELTCSNLLLEARSYGAYLRVYFRLCNPSDRDLRVGEIGCRPCSLHCQAHIACPNEL